MNPFLFIVAPVGVLAVVALIWLLGGLRDARLADAAAARARLAELEPGFVIDEVTVATGGAGAIVAGEGDRRPRIAVLVPLGDSFVSRVLGPDDLVGVAIAGAGLRIDTRDFTRPRLEVPLAADEAARWAARLGALRGSSSGDPSHG